MTIESNDQWPYKPLGAGAMLKFSRSLINQFLRKRQPRVSHKTLNYNMRLKILYVRLSVVKEFHYLNFFYIPIAV